jgi:flagellar biosynthesis protein FlhG
MQDQAVELRRMMRRVDRGERGPSPAPRLVVVAGGKGGVGTTTSAVAYAAHRARQGQRVVLVDADPSGGDVTAYCPLDDEPHPDDNGLADVLSGRRSIHEVLRRGPLGMQIVLGGGCAAGPAGDSPLATQRLVEQVASLAGHADAIVVDAGRGGARFARRLALAADELVLVTTPDDVAVMDAYTAIKALLTEADSAGGRRSLPDIRICVRGADRSTAAAVRERLSRTAQRFLNLGLAHYEHEPFAATQASALRPAIDAAQRRAARSSPQ